MYQFEYHKPASIGAAIELMNEAEDGKFIAGGQTMLPTMKHRLASPTDLVDLSKIEGLQSIRVDAETVTIGAMTTHAAVAASAEIRQAIPALAALAGNIGDPAVRNRGTLGGSIANNDPAADYPAALIALNAIVQTNSREIAAEDFFTGMFETALEENEIITQVRFACPTQASYQKFANPASRYAIAGVFAANFSSGLRIGVTGATAVAHRGARLEAALAGKQDPAAIAAALQGVALPVEKMNNDIHASAEYRADLVKTLTRKAVLACL
ncbi:MAG: xanthine dehydrogenase family protein subunit M [Gammaproteobacteria bacterium]